MGVPTNYPSYGRPFLNDFVLKPIETYWNLWQLGDPPITTPMIYMPGVSPLSMAQTSLDFPSPSEFWHRSPLAVLGKFWAILMLFIVVPCILFYLIFDKLLILMFMIFAALLRQLLNTSVLLKTRVRQNWPPRGVFRLTSKIISTGSHILEPPKLVSKCCKCRIRALFTHPASHNLEFSFSLKDHHFSLLLQT
jgi:hypothetical protein